VVRNGKSKTGRQMNNDQETLEALIQAVNQLSNNIEILMKSANVSSGIVIRKNSPETVKLESQADRIRCKVVQAHHEHGYVFLLDSDGDFHAAFIRPKIWVENIKRILVEGSTTEIWFPKKAKWYLILSVKGVIKSVGPKSIKLSIEDLGNTEHWIYKSQTALIQDEDGKYIPATYKVLNNLKKNQKIVMGVSPWMAKKLNIIENIEEFEVWDT
jgi:hypothetical protein